MKLNVLILLVVALLACPADSATAPDRTSQAIIYAYGHRLDPPFEIRVDGDTVRVNGLPYFPRRSRWDKHANIEARKEAIRASMTLGERATVERREQEVSSVIEAVTNLLARAEIDSSDIETRVALTAEACRSNPQVIDVRRSAATVTARFADGYEYDFIFPVSPSTPPPGGRSFAERSAVAIEGLNSYLRNGCLLLFGGSYHIGIPPPESVETLRQIDLLRSEVHWVDSATTSVHLGKAFVSDLRAVHRGGGR